MPSGQCPSAEEMRAFSAGNLPTATFGQIAEHVQACAECDAFLQAFDADADGLVAGLRHIKSAPADDNALPHEILKIARGALDGSNQSTEFSIDAGRKYAHKLASGD